MDKSNIKINYITFKYNYVRIIKIKNNNNNNSSTMYCDIVNENENIIYFISIVYSVYVNVFYDNISK